VDQSSQLRHEARSAGEHAQYVGAHVCHVRSVSYGHA
jgi:hypothetical protein